MVIAHRGYSQVAQENTISAFDAAVKAGAGGIECDVRLTKDNKAVINHNKHILIGGKKIKICKHSLLELQKLCKLTGRKILTLDELFDYIKRKENVEFFLEIKSSSPTLIDLIAEKIKKEKLWKRIHIMGFSLMVRNAIKAQRKHPELKIGQLLNFPPLAYIKKPKKSYSIFLGWLDGLRGSQTLFRLFFPPKRLTKFKNFLEKHGFKVMGGVINNKEGLDLFAQAGITDIVTDKVAETVAYFKRNN